jgi:hypothetical protein
MRASSIVNEELIFGNEEEPKHKSIDRAMVHLEAKLVIVH